MSEDTVRDGEGWLFYVDDMPEELQLALDERNGEFGKLSDVPGLEFIASDIQRWLHDQPIRVAFLGGTPALHGRIVAATAQITDSCGLELDFGHDAAAGTFRTWSPFDRTYAAEIRVRFDLPGFFSLVGTDSIDPDIGRGGGSVGGSPGQGSLNLGGFNRQLPQNWQGVVRHEFMHAIAFLHEHQNTRGPCEEAFRWEDDAGYEPTTDPRGTFVPDASNRRPGIYTYLSGPPNRWSRAKVDHNLRTVDRPDSVESRFDRQSVMLYRFPELFYAVQDSPCTPSGPGIDLSDGDKRGLLLLYPRLKAEIEAVRARKENVAEMLESGRGQADAGGLEYVSPDLGQRLAKLVRRSLAHRP